LQSKLLAGSDEQDPLLEKVQGVESVTISLDPEVLVSTDLRHSLIREKIRRLEQIKMLPL
jgi:copper chaperone CopZ